MLDRERRDRIQAETWRGPAALAYRPIDLRFALRCANGKVGANGRSATGRDAAMVAAIFGAIAEAPELPATEMKWEFGSAEPTARCFGWGEDGRRGRRADPETEQAAHQAPPIGAGCYCLGKRIETVVFHGIEPRWWMKATVLIEDNEGNCHYSSTFFPECKT